MGFDTRFGEDEYESAGTDCVSNKKTIQPRQLNNIYNELMHVVNTATFVQSIEIDECGWVWREIRLKVFFFKIFSNRTKNEPCSNGSEPPIGKKLMCRQKYVKITLKAFRDNDTTQLVDEQFYYPSHCICELVQRKRRSWNSKKRQNKTEIFNFTKTFIFLYSTVFTNLE